MLGNRVIQPGKCPWSSQIVLVKNKNVYNICFSVNYGKVNSLIVKDTHPLGPLPNMYGTLTRLMDVVL
jgi:hypothetical protein